MNGPSILSLSFQKECSHKSVLTSLRLPSWQLEMIRKSKNLRLKSVSLISVATFGAVNPIFYEFPGLKPENIYVDGWSIGWDKRFPKRQRLQQALIFARFGEHDNLYAHPLVSSIRIISFMAHQVV